MEAIQSAGRDALFSVEKPRAHDTRSVSTSWALFQGSALEDILRAAFWRSPNSFISSTCEISLQVRPGSQRLLLWGRLLPSPPPVSLPPRDMPPQVSFCAGLA